jgi:hypothetical protein
MKQTQTYNDLTFTGYHGDTNIEICEYRNPSTDFKIYIDIEEIPVVIEILKTYIRKKGI